MIGFLVGSVFGLVYTRLRELPTPPAPTKPPARHWERCAACDCAFTAENPARRWYGLCAGCYAGVPPADLAYYNSVTQRWRKAARTGFRKADHEALVWERDPSPEQVMLLRLVERFGLRTCAGTEGTPCEGLDRRLGTPPALIDAALRGKAGLSDLARHRLVKGALLWLERDEALCRRLADEWGDDDADADPDDPDVLAVAAALRHALGRTA